MELGTLNFIAILISIFFLFILFIFFYSTATIFSHDLIVRGYKTSMIHAYHLSMDRYSHCVYYSFNFAYAN